MDSEAPRPVTWVTHYLLILFQRGHITGSSEDRSLKLLSIPTVRKAPGQEALRVSDLWVPMREFQAFNQGSFCGNLASHLSPKSSVSRLKPPCFLKPI